MGALQPDEGKCARACQTEMIYCVEAVAIMVSWNRYELVVVGNVGVVEMMWWWFVVVMFENGCGFWSCWMMRFDDATRCDGALGGESSEELSDQSGRRLLRGCIARF